MDSLTIAYTLIVIGMLLLLAELILPTHGVLACLGGVSALIGVAFSFRDGLYTGVTTLVGTVVVMPLIAAVAMYLWPMTPMGRRIILQGPDDDAAVANSPVQLELEQLRGQVGRTVSALRPCGIVDFGGKRVDTMADDVMIEPNQWVRCVDIKAGRVLVRKVDGPPDLGGIDTALFG